MLTARGKLGFLDQNVVVAPHIYDAQAHAGNAERWYVRPPVLAPSRTLNDHSLNVTVATRIVEPTTRIHYVWTDHLLIAHCSDTYNG